ncbi:unnamed protein product [Thelazia callipaeda]|uniref:SCP domain-containing protein n=1 Tax=Thelazia callipaeda TaxID=103827 RepID=A0A0N5D3W1_THECL|nr:unnamed protein product [Thelazia callipaeda]
MSKRVKRERAFDLAHIESNLEQKRLHLQWQKLGIRYLDLHEKRCQHRCDHNLLLGHDMVQGHLAFGSIGLPAMIEEHDLKLFCHLNSQHSNCLHDCGFIVQFNANDFVCKKFYTQMINLMPCYKHALPTLRRVCGAQQCGPYTYVDKTIVGYAHRCRLLICDIKCTSDVLIQQCGNRFGQKAAQFLMNYTNQQVSFWMQDSNLRDTVPPSCSRLFCHKSDIRHCFL